MTDTSDIQARVEAIRAEVAAENAVAEQAAQSEEAAIEKMNAAKVECAQMCGPISEAVAEAVSVRERNELIALETEIHERHREILENAYLEFSGQREGDSNPAPPGEVTNIESHVSSGAEVATEATS